MGAFIGNDFSQLTFRKNIVVGNSAFAISNLLDKIICDGWSSLPSDWGSGIFLISNVYGYVSSINSGLSSTAVLEFLQAHGLGQNWQAV
jgi:hypothetical protein